MEVRQIKEHRIAHVIATALMLCWCSVTLRAQIAPELEKERELFLADLSTLLLGRNQPVPLDNQSFRGIVLAPPGTAISPLITAFDAQSADFQSVAQITDAISAVDKPLLVQSGIGSGSDRTISDIWETILQNSMPKPPRSPEELVTNVDVGRWLFRQPDAVDLVRGVRFDREPSDYLLRFREFESTFQLLTATEQRDDGAWRLHPRLAGFTRLQEAKAAILADWVKYGYKIEVERADYSFRQAALVEPWAAWSNAKANFDSERVLINPQRSVSRTFLFPPPFTWMTLSTWLNGSARSIQGRQIATFQIARVRINRLWFPLESLLDGSIQIDSNASAKVGLISDGTTPTLLNYPRGRLSVIPEEILIVRQIRFPVESDKTNNPLGVFAYPDTINLVGYIVRVLPKLP